MKKFKYVHWLKFDDESELRPWLELREYWKTHDCNIEVFYRVYNFLDKVIKLECNQSYNDLELNVNSMSSNTIRLKHKPQNIKSYNKPIESYFERYIDKGAASE